MRQWKQIFLNFLNFWRDFKSPDNSQDRDSLKIRWTRGKADSKLGSKLCIPSRKFLFLHNKKQTKHQNL